MRKTTGPAARKVAEWQDLTCWVVGLNQRADFYVVVGSSIGNTDQFLAFEFISLDKIPFSSFQIEQMFALFKRRTLCR